MFKSHSGLSLLAFQYIRTVSRLWDSMCIYIYIHSIHIYFTFFICCTLRNFPVQYWIFRNAVTISTHACTCSCLKHCVNCRWFEPSSGSASVHGQVAADQRCPSWSVIPLESRRRRTKGSVVGEEWCQNAAPLRWYTKNVFAQSKMILSRAWLHDTVSCAAWNDARKGIYLKPLFKTPCSNCYWGWSIPIMLDYRDISLMESVPLMWGPVTASPVGIEPMTIFGGGPPPPYNWYPIHNGENSMNCTGWPPNTP